MTIGLPAQTGCSSTIDVGGIPKPGIRFREHMAGSFSESVGPDGDFRAGAALGRATGSTLSTDLTITHDDLLALVADPRVPATITGEIRAPALSAAPIVVTEGRFVLLTPDPTHVETGNMLYQIEARTNDGIRYRLVGFKVVHQGPAADAWRDTTTLYVTIFRIHSSGSSTFHGRGVLRVTVSALRRLLASIEILNVPRRLDRERLRYDFAARFVGSLWPYYGGSLRERARFPAPPTEEPSLPRPGGLTPADIRWCDPSGIWHDHVAPGACSRLIRYRGGDKGPVMLAPGYGMSSTSFALETGHPNLLQFLLESEYDVWLFDFRAGIDLPSAWSPCTIDDIATIDWPRAVEEVRRITGRDDVQAFGHCVGSVSLLMTLLHGTRGIRSAMCAQFTVHPVTSTLNKAKARLHVGVAMADIGLTRLHPDTSLTLADAALDMALRPVPVPRGERCGLAVCRWINAVYGLTHVHDQLDDATHLEIARLFGVGNLTGLRHLNLILQRGVAVDAWGLDRYLPHVERLDLPIHFLAGTRNYIFHPEGTQRTMKWLREAHGADRASRNYSVTYLDDYGHLDAIIGRDAAVDVFPDIVKHLDVHALS
jgi:cholesterol oxidase